MFSELRVLPITLGRVAHGAGQQLGLSGFTGANDATVVKCKMKDLRVFQRITIRQKSGAVVGPKSACSDAFSSRYSLLFILRI